MIDKSFFARQVLRLRRERGLTQHRLSALLNVTPQAISKWETGGSLPDIEILLKLSHLSGISVNELLEETPGRKAFR